MGYNLFPISHGNHDNLHFIFKVGSKRKPMINIKIVAFLNTGKAYITHSMYKFPTNLINFKELFKVINECFEKYDMELVVNESDWENKNLTTEQLLTKLKN